MKSKTKPFIERSYEAMKRFVEKVETGKARSKKTYAEMKSLIEEYEKIWMERLNGIHQREEEIKKEEKLFVLHQHNGEYASWYEIKSADLEKWMTDGSIQEGDLVIYPAMIMEAEKEIKIKLRGKV